MSKPVQLIINDILLPLTTRDRYQAPLEPLRTSVDMISGRRVTESRGLVRKIVWSYDYMGDAEVKEILKVLRTEDSLLVSYIPDDGDELIVSRFKVESITPPTLAFYKNGVPKWHNLSFVLREVKPSA